MEIYVKIGHIEIYSETAASSAYCIAMNGDFTLSLFNNELVRISNNNFSYEFRQVSDITKINDFTSDISPLPVTLRELFDILLPFADVTSGGGGGGGGDASAANQLTEIARLTTLANNLQDKLKRIQGASNYTRTFSYYSTTSNVTQIVHTGTTPLGNETVTETITYISPGADFRVQTITYS